MKRKAPLHLLEKKKTHSAKLAKLTVSATVEKYGLQQNYIYTDEVCSVLIFTDKRMSTRNWK